MSHVSYPSVLVTHLQKFSERAVSGNSTGREPNFPRASFVVITLVLFLAILCLPWR
jgi:hypothetical protein